MTTVRQLITDGFRESGIVGVDETPGAAEFEEALRRLNSIFKGLFGNELGENLATCNYGTNGLSNSYAKAIDDSSNIDSIYVPTNLRLILNIPSAVTLYLHPNPNDGARLGLIDNSHNLATYNATLNGNGRQIESTNSIVLNTNGLNREWFYRADLGSWVRVSDLVADDESPFPTEFDDFLTAILAFRINPRYGATTAQELGDILTRMRRAFRARYRQTTEQPSEDGIVRLSSNKYWLFSGSSVNNFNKGS